MEQKSLINEYRSICAGDKPKQLTSLEEFIWNGTYTISLLFDDKSLKLPFEFEGEEVVHLVVKDQTRNDNNQNDRVVVQTLTRVEHLSGHLLTYTRTRRYMNGEHKWGEWVCSDSENGGTIAVDSGINPESYNPVQNKAIAEALEEAVARGRELAKRDLYIAAGALYNDTDEIIKRTAFWGEEVDHLPKHYYLNGLGDITENEMIVIYSYKDIMTHIIEGKASRTLQLLNKCRTYFGTFPSRILDGRFLTGTCPIDDNKIEIIKWYNTQQTGSYTSNLTLNSQCFVVTCARLKAIERCKVNNSKAVDRCPALEHIEFHGLKINVDLNQSSKISKNSVLYMICNSDATSAITITLHADAFARLSVDEDVIAALEAKPLVSLVSA